MKKLIVTLLAATMLASTATPGVLAKSTIQPNEQVYGYQSVDFEEGYTVGEVVMSNPLSGGQISKDGKLYCSVEDTQTTQTATAESVAVTIAGDSDNKYLKIEDKDASGAVFANFKMLNTDSALNDDMDYFVLKCRLKNGDSSANAAGYLGVFRNIRFDDSGNFGSYKLSPAYGWNDYMFVADRAAGKMYVAVDGQLTDIVCTDNAYKTINDFLSSQFSTQYSSTKCTFYIDDLELYGVKSETHDSAVCTLTTDSDDPSAVYASFTQPVKLSDANVSVSGADLAGISFADGKYRIALSNVPASGASVDVSGVSDIFGKSVNSAACRIYGNEKQFYQKIDFENYDIGSFINDNKESADRIFEVGENTYLTYNIVEENGGKALKIVEPAKSVPNSPYISAYNRNAAAADTADYLVVSYDLKNGSDAEHEFDYLSLARDYEIRHNGESIYLSNNYAGRYDIPKKQWANYMRVLEKATGKIYTIVDGNITDITTTGTATADWFFRLQWDVGYSANKEYDQVAYIDNVEMYGINTADAVNECTVIPPSADDAKAYVSFSHPAKLTKDDITVTGGAEVQGVEYKNGKYEVVFGGLEANSSYTMTVKEVADIFGAKSEQKTADFALGKLQNTKSYLATDARFSGKEDFEGYSNDGIVVSADSSEEVTATKNGYSIKNIWSLTTGRNGDIKTALVKENDGNTALKMYIPTTAVSNVSTTGILQPWPDTDWTSAAKGKTFVYKARVKSGGDGENVFYNAPFGNAILYFADGVATIGGSSAKVLRSAGEWNDFEYTIDCTGDTMIQHLAVNGVYVGSLKENLSTIAINSPRWEVCYPYGGKDNCSLYFDDIEIYTTAGIKNNITASLVKDSIKCGEGVTVAFDAPVAAFAPENVTADAAADKIIPLGGNKYNIRFTEALAEGAHTITLKNVADIYGNTLGEQVLSFNVVGGGKIEAITGIGTDGNGNMTVTILNSGAAAAGRTVYAAAYEGGVLKNVVKADITVGMGENTYTLNGAVSGNSVKVFLWNNTMVPDCAEFAQ